MTTNLRHGTARLSTDSDCLAETSIRIWILTLCCSCQDYLLYSERHHYVSATRLHADELKAILLVESTEWNGEIWGVEHDVSGQPLSRVGCRGSYSGRSAVVFTSIWSPFKATTTLPGLAAMAIACVGEGGAGNAPCKAHDVSILRVTS